MRPDDFYVRAHQFVFRAMIALSERGGEIDPILLGDELRREGRLEQVGGASSVAELTYGPPHFTDIAAYAKMVGGKSLNRAAYRATIRLASAFLEEEDEPAVLIERMGRRSPISTRSAPAPARVVALGTGMRLTEQLSMRVKQVDFPRNLVTAVHTKTGRNRQTPMSPDVRDALLVLCWGKRPDDFVFYNPRTGDRVKEIKTALKSACTDAGIEAFQWKF